MGWSDRGPRKKGTMSKANRYPDEILIATKDVRRGGSLEDRAAYGRCAHRTTREPRAHLAVRKGKESSSFARPIELYKVGAGSFDFIFVINF